MPEPNPLPGAPAPPLPPAVFAARRAALLARVGESVVVLRAGEERYKSRDTDLRFRADSDFYYLTGITEPGAVAVLCGHAEAPPFTLFVRPRDPQREVWTGPRLGVERALARSGADEAHPLGELEERLPALVRSARRIVYAVGTDPAWDARMAALVAESRRARPRSGVGPTALDDLEPLVAGLRLVKDAHEIERIRTAAAISAQGHRAAMRAARPGAGEWELESALEGTFRRLGADGPAFPTIVGSGPNATYLHYISNQRRVAEGELILVDGGAEWGMYCGDISRTFPASGRFTPAQRAAYQVVLAAEEAAIAAVRPGATVAAVHDAAVRALVAGMLHLGLLHGADEEALVQEGAHRAYYLHQTSHWLGLDVHDVGPYREGDLSLQLQPGMVLTVEPGLYVSPDAAEAPPELRGVGIRIEDDVLVTPAGRDVLTRGVPVDPDEIEALMSAR